MRAVLLPVGWIRQYRTKKLMVVIRVGGQIINISPSVEMTLKSPRQHFLHISLCSLTHQCAGGVEILD
jgi:hypothetical protein